MKASNAAEDIHAFVLSSGVMHDIGTLGGTTSVGRSINESGQVAGESRINAGQVTRAFRFSPGAGMVNLGTLSGGTASSAYGINNNGQVVGESAAEARGEDRLGLEVVHHQEGGGRRRLRADPAGHEHEGRRFVEAEVLDAARRRGKRGEGGIQLGLQRGDDAQLHAGTRTSS